MFRLSFRRSKKLVSSPQATSISTNSGSGSLEKKMMNKAIVSPDNESVSTPPPEIQAVATSESWSTAATAYTNSNENNDNHDGGFIVPPKKAMTLTVDVIDDPPSPADEETISTIDPYGYDYFSLQELETLLTPRFLEDFETIAHEEQRDHEQERQFRKDLIQRELNALIQSLLANDDSEDHEVEPELVEALGIAANHVTYRKKFYDVASCQYIYVPSVAHAILDGSLLEEATQYYFGKSEEFLVLYAARLGHAVIQSQQSNALQMRGTHDDDLLEDVDVSSIASVHHQAPSSPSINDAAVKSIANSCFGVSPVNRSTTAASSKIFRFETTGATTTPSTGTPSPEDVAAVAPTSRQKWNYTWLLACFLVPTAIIGMGYSLPAVRLLDGGSRPRMTTTSGAASIINDLRPAFVVSTSTILEEHFNVDGLVSGDDLNKMEEAVLTKGLEDKGDTTTAPLRMDGAQESFGRRNRPIVANLLYYV